MPGVEELGIGSDWVEVALAGIARVVVLVAAVIVVVIVVALVAVALTKERAMSKKMRSVRSIVESVGFSMAFASGSFLSQCEIQS